MSKVPPNRVSRKDIDDVWISTANEVIEKRAKKRPDPLVTMTDAQRQHNLAKGEKIVERAKARKEKSK